jgi:hypothetical protein
MTKPRDDSRYYQRLLAAKRIIIEDALAKTDGNVVAAAKYLGIDYGGLYRRCKTLGIDPTAMRRPKDAPREPVKARPPALTGWLAEVAAPEGENDDTD